MIGDIIAGLACAAGGVGVYEGVQTVLFGPPQWWPFGRTEDVGTIRGFKYGEPIWDEANRFVESQQPPTIRGTRGEPASATFMDEPMGDDALRMIREEVPAVALDEEQTQLVRGMYRPRSHRIPAGTPTDEAVRQALQPIRDFGQTAAEAVTNATRWRDRQQPGTLPATWIPDEDDGPDEVTGEPLSADAADSSAPDDTWLIRPDPADLPAARDHAAEPDWMTPPPPRTSKDCACGDRVAASRWGDRAHVEHRRVAGLAWDATTPANLRDATTGKD